MSWRLSAGQKTARTRKGREAQRRAEKTEHLARTFANYALTELGYERVFFLSRKGNEPTRIVDLVATKKSGDDTELILFQVKRNQKVSQEEIDRLREVARRTRVKYGIVEYQKGKLPTPQIFELR